MRIPPSLLLGMGRFLLFILLEAICIYMIGSNGIVQQYRIMEKVRQVQGFFWEKQSALQEYSSLRGENSRLAQENTALMQELYAYRELAQGEDNTPTDYPFSFIPAKVIKNTLNTTHNYIIINKGSKDGVEVDMGVITPNGVVGIVRGVSPRYSYVLSFLNTGQQVSARIGHDGVFGPLTWNPHKTGMALLGEIPQHEQINLADTVYTSGFSSLYPPDIPIGTIQGSKVVNGVHLSIDVKLLQEFRQLKHVMVVRNNSREEMEELIKGTK